MLGKLKIGVRNRIEHRRSVATDVQFSLTGKGILKVGARCSELRMYIRNEELKRGDYGEKKWQFLPSARRASWSCCMYSPIAEVREFSAVKLKSNPGAALVDAREQGRDLMFNNPLKLHLKRLMNSVRLQTPWASILFPYSTRMQWI